MPIILKNKDGVLLKTAGKYCPEDITVVPQLQEKTVTPSETQQTATPDANYAGLSKVTIGAIPPDYVIPSGTIQITENGVVDVSGKANANVNVPTGVDTSDATAVASDILSGKTAYAKGVKLTGSVLTYDGAFVGNTHTITATLTNVIAASGNATTIAVGETKVLTYTAADGYALPDTVTVTGATGVWNKANGTLTLSNPTANVTFTIAGVEQSATKYTISVTNTGNYAITFEQNGVTLATVDGSGGGGTGSGSFEAEAGTVTSSTGALYTQDNTVCTGGVSVNDATSTSPTFTITGDGTITVDPWCIIEGTQITLADGTTKVIEDITYDDELLVWNFYEGKFDTAKPTWIKVAEVAPRYNLVKFSNGSEVGFVGAGGEKGYHRIFNKEAGAFTHIGTNATPIGTTTFADDGTNPTIVSEEIIEKPVKYYNIITDKHYNIFANGILTSCRLSNKYHIEDMKYIGEPVIHEQEEKEYRERLEKNRKWLG